MNLRAKLSLRELEIVELLVFGKPKKLVAQLLFISVHTVDSHLRNIFEKTGTKRVAVLCVWYFVMEFGLDLSDKHKALITVLLFALTIGIEYANLETIRVRSLKIPKASIHRASRVRTGRAMQKLEFLTA